MKAKMIIVIFLTSMLALIWSSAAWAADRFNTRANRQTRRIHQGIRSGKITRPEARRLKKEQRHIHRAYNRALADCHLNRHERRRLDKMQDRASRHIYRAKHNHARRHLHGQYHNGGHRTLGIIMESQAEKKSAGQFKPWGDNLSLKYFKEDRDMGAKPRIVEKVRT